MDWSGDPIVGLSAALLLAGALAVIARLLRQPPILGYIAAGFGLSLFSWEQNRELFNAFSTIGITLLLFLIGLELNWSNLQKIARAAAILAGLQISLTFGLGYGVGLVLGLTPLAAVVIGGALTFSSTVVVLQLIAAKNDVASLYGKLSVGLLIIQDLAAVAALVLLSGFTSQDRFMWWIELPLLAGKLLLLFTVTWLIGTQILARFFARLAKARDTMVVVAMAWCFTVAAAAHFFGFSYEIGAFAAGLTLAAIPFSQDIFGQVRPLRDFFIVLFFVLLGLSIDPAAGVDWRLTGALAVLALLAKPLIILVALALQRFRVRTGFLTAVALGQLSEFSVILAMAAASAGLVSQTVLTSVIVATALTFAVSSFIINHAEKFYGWLRPALKTLQLTGVNYYFESTPKQSDHVIIFGYHRMGYHILRSLRRLGHEVLVVDFNPDVIARLRALSVPSVFGDAADPELLDTIHLKSAKLIVSTIPYLEENLTLIKHVRSAHKTIAVIVTAQDIDDALLLYRAGADYVILPKLLSGERVAELLDRYSTGTLKNYLRRHRTDSALLRTKKNELYI